MRAKRPDHQQRARASGKQRVGFRSRLGLPRVLYRYEAHTLVGAVKIENLLTGALRKRDGHWGQNVSYDYLWVVSVSSSPFYSGRTWDSSTALNVCVASPTAVP